MDILDFFQDYQIGGLNKKVDTAQAQIEAKLRMEKMRSNAKSLAQNRKLEERISELENQLHSSLLLVEALIETLEGKEITNRVDFLKKVKAIDGRDGVLDGKITPKKTQNDTENKFIFPEED